MTEIKKAGRPAGSKNVNGKGKQVWIGQKHLEHVEALIAELKIAELKEKEKEKEAVATQ